MMGARRLSGARRPSPSGPDAGCGRVRARNRFSQLPAFALLLGALCLLPAAPGGAQTTTIWTATLTVGQDAGSQTSAHAYVGSNADFYNDPDPFGSLSDTDFMVGANTYTIQSLRWGTQLSSGSEDSKSVMTTALPGLDSRVIAVTRRDDPSGRCWSRVNDDQGHRLNV